MAKFLSHLLPGADLPLTVSAPGRTDPWDSGIWPLHRKDLLGNPPDWRNDAGVMVLGPDAAEDAMHVPFAIDATAFPETERIVVTIDYSPIPKALTFRPGRALPFIGFGVKYESGSPLRASVQLASGEWRMGAHFVSAMGGGCTAPAAAHDRPDWQEGFGDMRARLWPETGRLRVWLRHPQDTGLFYVPANNWTEDYWTEEITYNAGAAYLGQGFRIKRLYDDHIGTLRAFDPATGEMKWEHREEFPLWAGVLATAGDLVFTGTSDGFVKAFHSENGEQLREFNTGSGVVAQPVTWELDGKQYLCIASGYGGAVPLWGGDMATLTTQVSQGGSFWVFEIPDELLAMAN